MSGKTADPYQPQGGHDVGEANRVLARLEKETIRFRIVPNTAGRRNFRLPLKDPRIQLFIHSDDLEAWQRIRSEFFPI